TCSKSGAHPLLRRPISVYDINHKLERTPHRWLLAVLGIGKGNPLAPEGQEDQSRASSTRRAGGARPQLSLLSLTGSLYERGNVLDNDTCLGGLDQHRCIRPFLENLGIWVARVEEKWDPSTGECAAGC